MATGLVLSVVRLGRVSGLPEDAVEMTFAWGIVDISLGDAADDIQSRLEAFFKTNLSGSSSPVGAWVNESVSRSTNATQTLYYFTEDFTGSTPLGSPFEVKTWTFYGANNATALPSEVAICLSFHGTLTDVAETAPNPDPPPATIRPAAQRRGRVFLGPLISTSVLSIDGTTKEARVATTPLTSLANSCEGLQALNTDEVAWVVWSRRGAAVWVIEGGFVDNAFDVQRRRGVAATSRTTWAQP